MANKANGTHINQRCLQGPLYSNVSLTYLCTKRPYTGIFYFIYWSQVHSTYDTRCFQLTKEKTETHDILYIFRWWWSILTCLINLPNYIMYIIIHRTLPLGLYKSPHPPCLYSTSPSRLPPSTVRTGCAPPRPHITRKPASHNPASGPASW